MSDYFARELLASLDADDPNAVMLHSNAQARAAGFRYQDDEEVIGQLRSETAELIEAFRGGSVQAIEDEGIDVVRVVLEMIRLRGGDYRRAQRENIRKYLRRLAFVEQELEDRGLAWKDVKWPDDIKPIWKRAKAAKS
ncbi:MAG TPA: hypothetical protein VIF43_00630 [Patescibacteria group bacterium]|jgi:uncharacterized protein YabN with tetrapyrrole methylase and pyrophosphatase domain